ncbi:MAG: M20/M25/M40 family metallo-hydrolase [Erysipelotrichaceae bacterium]
MSEYKSFDLLEKLYFVRTAGSQQDKKAADILANECKKFTDDVVLEEFEIDGYEIHKAQLSFHEPEMSFECAGVGLSSSTGEEGITADFCYLSSEADVELSDIEGKICLVIGKLVKVSMYKKIFAKKAAGLILTTGSVYDSNQDTDLDPYMYRDKHYKIGKIPAVCISNHDAEQLLRAMPKKATLTVIQTEKVNKTNNVVATIKGTGKPDEVVAFTAHYDSVDFSKGAYDNATGCICIMQLLSYFSQHKPSRTLKFIFCGAEEMGLLGSKAYVEKHEEQLSQYCLNINVDMVAVTIGYDIACATSGMDLVNYINYEGKINGFAIMAKQGVYSSDSTPFADKGVPAVSFARIAPNGGAVIHSKKDVIDFLSEANYYSTCDFITKFAERLINSACFPVKREIPENMKEELDYYNGRKERKN